MTRVLVVEGDPQVRRVVLEALGAEGYDVVAVSDPDAALRHMEATAPDLLICDCGSGGAAGLALLRSVRSSHPQVPVVTMGDGDPERWEDVLRTALLNGASDTLVKPLDPRRLVAAARRLLSEESWASFGELA